MRGLSSGRGGLGREPRGSRPRAQTDARESTLRSRRRNAAADAARPASPRSGTGSATRGTGIANRLRRSRSCWDAVACDPAGIAGSSCACWSPAPAGSSGASSGKASRATTPWRGSISAAISAKGIRRADVRRARSLRRAFARSTPSWISRPARPRPALGSGRGRHRGPRQHPRGGSSQRCAALCLRELEPRHGHVRARPAVRIHRRRRLRRASILPRSR